MLKSATSKPIKMSEIRTETVTEISTNKNIDKVEQLSTRSQNFLEDFKDRNGNRQRAITRKLSL